MPEREKEKWVGGGGGVHGGQKEDKPGASSPRPLHDSYSAYYT